MSFEDPSFESSEPFIFPSSEESSSSSEESSSSGEPSSWDSPSSDPDSSSSSESSQPWYDPNPYPSSSDAPSSSEESPSSEESSSISSWEEVSDPVPVTAGLHLWLRSDRHVTLVESDRVVQWADARGNGPVASQDDQAERPSWQPDAILSGTVIQSAVVFDGQTSLRLPLEFIHPAGTFTLFVAAEAGENRQNGPLTSGQRILWGPALGETCACLSIGSDSAALYETAIPSSPLMERTLSSNDSGMPFPLTLRYTAEGRYFFADGPVSFPAGEQVALGHHLGGFAGSSSGDGFAGDVAEILLYDRDLDGTERQQVIGYLQTRYGRVPSSSSSSSEESSASSEPWWPSESLSSESSSMISEEPSSSSSDPSSESSSNSDPSSESSTTSDPSSESSSESSEESNSSSESSESSESQANKSGSQPPWRSSTLVHPAASAALRW